MGSKLFDIAISAILKIIAPWAIEKNRTASNKKVFAQQRLPTK